ncbi:MAG: helix-turn-helix transcriptional regulator [Dactylosporangium sp.]|nr:helix-turn-helix transcriptional regulator [Dactylosporangium sp.]NNJ61663.1 helix-turn-helix transcriptional regulator [Dactylosporangium sp.]
MARRQLRLKLRRARREANLTQNEVANALDWSASKLLRIENGTSTIAVSDLIALLTQYSGLAPERESLLELARESKSPLLVSRYADVLTPQFSTWLDHEAYADNIRQFEPLIIPGVLQTDEYAAAVVAGLIDRESDDRDPVRIVAARRARIESLIRPSSPKLEFIIDDAAVHRAVGNEDGARGFTLMIDQLRHLKKLNTVGRQASGETIEPDLNPHISVQIVPFLAGAYRAMRGPFEIIELEASGEEDQFMMYHENPEGDVVIREDYGPIEKHIQVFENLKKILPAPTDTNDHIDRVIQRFQ